MGGGGVLGMGVKCSFRDGDRQIDRQIVKVHAVLDRGKEEGEA